MQRSQKIQRIIAVVCGLILVAVITSILINNSQSQTDTVKNVPNSQNQSSAETEEKSAEVSPEKEVTDKTEPGQDSYSFTAVAGDSYTALARKAVGQYIATNQLSTSKAQQARFAAALASNAGSPLLEIGQVVTIQESDIATLIGKPSGTTETPKEADNKDTIDDNSKQDATSTDYSYTADRGDSYSILARRAISEHSVGINLKLTSSQRIAAETTIITAAGFPRLSVGQKVTFSYIDIKDAVSEAQVLSAEQLMIWQPYAARAGL